MVIPAPEPDRTDRSQHQPDISETRVKIWRDHLADQAMETLREKLESVECDS